MNIEDAMIEELNTIAEISGKVYPIPAPRTDVNDNPVLAPYVIFVSSYGNQGKSLDGFQSDKSVDIELNIIGRTYPEMKAVTKEVMSSITSFEQRVIGTDGPFIQEVTYERPTEHYEPAPKLYRCNVMVTFYFNEEV